MIKNIQQLRNYVKLLRTRSYSSKVQNAEENIPVKFSTSPAAKARPVPVLSKPSNAPWYQPYSVICSVAVFMLYFCVIREENDIDTEFNKTLYDRFKGLEKQQLLLSYSYNKENGKSLIEIEQRLREIEEEESKALA
ncbi:unnamed protein product [Leptosia nina]|uniref:Uncharacterized protein n=1 Tax=Leptosia nina TaxID=320188 RepID=A0AAV1JBZ8_9NEOP